MIGQVHQRLQIARAARVVHQNVNPAEMLDGVIDEAFEVGLVHHIACADFLKHLRAFVRIAREQGDAGALGQKRLGDPSSHARRAPGDGGDLSGQFHASSPLVIASLHSP